VVLANSTKHTQKKPVLRERTDRAWFSLLLQHPARKRSGSNLGAHKAPGCRSPHGASVGDGTCNKYPPHRLPSHQSTNQRL